MNSIFVGIDHVINVNQPKQNLSSGTTNPKVETSNGTDSNEFSSTYLRLKQKSKMNTKDFADINMLAFHLKEIACEIT